MQESLNSNTAAARLNLIYKIARLGVAATWIYHGLVPKLLYRDWSEMTLLHDAQVEITMVPFVLQVFGCLEIGLGLVVAGFWTARWPLWATLGIMIGSLLGVARNSPAVLHAAFNPVTLNGLLFLLAAVALLAQPTVLRPKAKPSRTR